MACLSALSRRLNGSCCPRLCSLGVRLEHDLTTDVPTTVGNVPWVPPPVPPATSLYVWGCNLGGMLAAREHTTARISTPEVFPMAPVNLRRPYQHVACGVDFTLVSTPRGKDYVYMGSNAYMAQALNLAGAVWANEDVKDRNLPMYDPEQSDEYFHTGCGAYQLHCQFWRYTGISKMAAGRAHAIFLSENGDLYFAGRHDELSYPIPKDLVETKEGQLDYRLLAPYTVGADDAELRESKSVTAYAVTQGLQRLMHSKDVAFRDVACGLEHTLVTDYYGFLYSWGLNTDGQCGRGTDELNCGFGLVEGPMSKVAVRALSTCADSCIALDKLGRLWTWGNNEYHQLMLPTDEPQVRSPTLVDKLHLQSAIGNDNRVVNVAMGGAFGALLDVDGKVWTWGWGAGLGQGVDNKLARWPRKVDLPGRATKIVAGINNMAVIMEDGSMYAWGAAIHDSVPVRATPGAGEHQQIEAAASSSQTGDAAALVDAEAMTKSVWAPRLVDFDYPVLDCAVGPHHMVALVEEVEI
ncbi:RCC1-like G exchanging factor-like protein [Sycon ciliatum]|uniref:RCC1-like G exchanging factor-like protein n=1 Tax=Sycon ciliatum TaxID=27933 RepID=UPI0031F63112